MHKANAQLKTASAAKSRFIANMSHEIRTPMNGVLGMAELLADTDQTQQQKQFTATIRSSAHVLLTVINDILDFSKIEAGKLELESARFSLREVVEGVASMLADQAQRNGVELIHELDDDVPTTALGDQGRLRQILINLVGNAVKFTTDGEIVVRVSVVERHEDVATVRFTVHDTGIGIGADAQHRIFDGFAQADGSMTRKHGGTGLGLTIAKSLTMMMGGEIGVVSEVGRGSEFWFTVRLEGARAATDDTRVADAGLEGSRISVDKEHRADSSQLPVEDDDIGPGRILTTQSIRRLPRRCSSGSGMLSMRSRTVHRPSQRIQPRPTT